MGHARVTPAAREVSPGATSEDAEDVRCENIFHPLANRGIASERDFLWRRVILYMENMTGRYRYRYLVHV